MRFVALLGAELRAGALSARIAPTASERLVGMLGRRVVAGLALLAVIVGFISYFAPTPAAVPLRVVAGGIGVAVGLYNFWRAMMEKSE